jgi:flagellar hook-basal body complex protein FliE
MVDKIANPAAAAGAYSNISKIGINADPAKNMEKGGFGAMMKEIAVNSINTLRHSETMAARAVTGEAQLPDVVQAVNAADVTINTVVAIRDRLINAYTEIMRMPI